jgi:hypothetical protein
LFSAGLLTCLVYLEEWNRRSDAVPRADLGAEVDQTERDESRAALKLFGDDAADLLTVNRTSIRDLIALLRLEVPAREISTGPWREAIVQWVRAGTGVLATHPGGVPALLEEAGLVKDQDGVGIAERIDDIIPEIVADRLGIPVGPAHEVLNAIGVSVADLLGDLPGILPLDEPQQADEIGPRALARLAYERTARDRTSCSTPRCSSGVNSRSATVWVMRLDVLHPCAAGSPDGGLVALHLEGQGDVMYDRE